MTKSLSKAIALATLVGATASAQAAPVAVNHDGLGEVLLYSLYTAEEGNITNINITNTTNVAKAVKVRFVEGQNSQEVLDFNLYLSPRDQWSGAVTATANGAQLITTDKSCTAPANIGLTGVEFKDLDFIGDGGEQSLARTRVGHLEVIEMGTLIGDLAKAVEAGNGPGQAPANCGAIAKAFAVGGVWEEGTNFQTGLKGTEVKKTDLIVGTPGGLYGSASILNIDGSTQISYDAVALKGFLAASNLHARPGTIYPTLDGVVEAGGNSFTRTGAGNKGTTVKEITAALAVSNIHNDFVLDEGRLSETNWVVTYPTKRFHVDVNMADGLANAAKIKLDEAKKVFDAAVVAASGDTTAIKTAQANLTAAEVTYKTDLAAALTPFQNVWNKGVSCDSVKLNVWDSEEFPLSDLEFSPSRPGEASKLCYETNILTFNGSKMLGGEFVSKNIELAQPDFQFGWMDIGFATTAAPKGLPAIGFSAVTVKNNNTSNGLNNNYGSATKHKATK